MIYEAYGFLSLAYLIPSHKIACIFAMNSAKYRKHHIL